MEISIQEIQNVFDKIKSLAQKEFENKNYELCLKYIEIAADVAYSFNWKYTDEDLENLLVAISDSIIAEKSAFIPMQGRVVFYDVFALDNKGLTQQYLRALISWGVELLFIFEGNDLSNSKQIISEIKSYSKAELYVVEATLTKVEKIESIYNKIIDFKPEKAFLHLFPSSVVAISIWNSLQEVTRYQINLTDHAFWLGTKCIDYCLEFRNYGCTVSNEKRNLSEDKLLIQPFYPIMQCKPFLGFPSQITDDDIKIFTGGNYYKMYGKSDFFFKLLKILIELNQKIVILLAGNGDDSPIEQFILDNNYEKRLFLLGSRSDITHVFENCDIYLSTFPFTGGLMGQYAASLSKPILSYSSADLPCNFSEGFINWNTNSSFKITHTTLDSFRIEALKMIESKSYREEKGNDNQKHIISENEFSVHLKKIVTTHRMERPFVKEVIDYDVFSKLYVDSENKYLKQFHFFIVSRFRLKAIFLFPKNVISFILMKSNWKFIFK